MAQNGILEALLRPPVELYSAVTAGLAAAVLFTAPWVFMMTPELGIVAGSGLLAFALWRVREAWQVLRYQLGLTRYRITRVAPHRLPRLRDRIYLGQGFAWTQQHTQRRIDATRPAAQPYIRPSLFVQCLRALLQGLRQTPLAPLTRWLLSSRFWWNPLGDQPDLGGTPVLHGVEPTEIPIGLSQRHRNGHLLVLGTTRVGKTRLLELLVTQDIRDGKVVIVIDPKGDADLMLRVYAEAARQAGSIVESERLLHAAAATLRDRR